jgi:exodeoxyribonuclease VII small subunit
MATKKQTTYRELRDRLDNIMLWFDRDDLDVDEALLKHAEAQKIIDELEAYLKNTEQKIKKVA